MPITQTLTVADTTTAAPTMFGDGFTSPVAPLTSGTVIETLTAGVETRTQDGGWVNLGSEISGESTTSASASSTHTASLVKTTHHVEVGPFGQLFFQPSQVDAEVGDVVKFKFRSFNHTLTQSSLEEPCVSSSQFDSGFRQFNPADSLFKTLSFSVNDPAPQYFFCHQQLPVNHCRRGMVFAINPGESMDRFLMNVDPSPTEATIPSQGFSSALGGSTGTGTQVMMRSVQPGPSTGEACRDNRNLTKRILLAALILSVFCRL
jgi:plastocyanin